MNDSGFICCTYYKTWGDCLRKQFFLPVFLLFMLDANAAPFRNLDFEEYDASRSVLPGWHLLFPPGIVRRINETNITIGRPPDYPDGPLAAIADVSLFPNQGMDGKYALLLESSRWTLSQQGDMPEDAKFLRWSSLGPLPMELKIDGVGVPVDYFYGSLFPRIQGYAQADISAYAGKSINMTLMVLPSPPQFSAPGQAYYSIVDNFGFSAVPIPEPSPLTLLGLGSLALLWRWKKTRG